MKLTAGHVGWAELIFTMEKKHVRRIKEKFPDLLHGKRLVCLNIPDEYRFMDEALIGLLISGVSEQIGDFEGASFETLMRHD